MANLLKTIETLNKSADAKLKEVKNKIAATNSNIIKGENNLLSIKKYINEYYKKNQGENTSTYFLANKEHFLDNLERSLIAQEYELKNLKLKLRSLQDDYMAVNIDIKKLEHIAENIKKKIDLKAQAKLNKELDAMNLLYLSYK